MIWVLFGLLAVVVLVVADVRRSGGWDPWDEFDGQAR